VHVRATILSSLIVLLSAGCASSDTTTKKDEASTSASKSVATFTVDIGTKGVALYDLETAYPVEVTNDADIRARTTPTVWLEPTDPEIAFIAAQPTDPALFDLKKHGPEVKKEAIKKGAVFVVTDAAGKTYRVTILDYVPGDRQTAKFVFSIDWP